MYIRRIIGFFLFCSIAFSAFAEMPYRTVLRKADDHFVNREWQEAVATDDTQSGSPPEQSRKSETALPDAESQNY